MTYVFDTNAFGHLFHSYYRGRFPSLWANYDLLVGNGSITSTREVYREIDDGPVEGLRDWAKANKKMFPTPTADEGLFIAQIFAVEHFQQVIEQNFSRSLNRKSCSRVARMPIPSSSPAPP